MAIPTGSGATRYHYFAGIDTTGGETVTIATASASNPRVDTVVAYIDKGITPKNPTNGGTVNNNNNMLKLVAVAGTPNASPTASSDSAIITAVGSGNPWIKLAYVYVGTGVTQMTQNNVTDGRAFPTAPSNVLGYAIKTDTFQANSTTPVQVTGLSKAVNVPTGGRLLKVTVFGSQMYNTAQRNVYLTLWDGPVGTGTQFARSGNIGVPIASTPAIAMGLLPANAGQKTINVGFQTTVEGTATLEAAPTYPVFLLIEAP